MPKHYSSDYEALTGVAPGQEQGETPVVEEHYESVLFVPEGGEEPKRTRKPAKTEE